MSIMLPSGISVRIREDLLSGAARTQTTLVVDPLVTITGHRITMTDIGDKGYGKLEQGTVREELMSWTGITDNGSTMTLTGCEWGINLHNLTAGVNENKKRHTVGSSFKITTDMHFVAEQYRDKDNNLFESPNDFEVKANKLKLGDGTDDNNKVITAANGDANEPFIEYNETTGKWNISNDGVNSYDPEQGGSGVTAGDAISIVAGAVNVKTKEASGVHITDDEVAIEYQTNPGLSIEDNKLGVKVKEDTGLLKDADGIYCDSIDPDNPVAQSPAQLIGGDDIILQNFIDYKNIDEDAGFKITIDEVVYDNIYIDLGQATDINSVATLLQTAIRAKTGNNETVIYNTDHFEISSTILGKNTISQVLKLEPSTNTTNNTYNEAQPAGATTKPWNTAGISKNGNVILVANNNGGDGSTVHLSSDGGLTWSSVAPTPNSWWQNAFVSEDGSIMYIHNTRLSNYNLYKRENGSWTTLSAQVYSGYHSKAVYSSNGQYIFATHRSNNTTYFSSNYGASFSSIINKTAIDLDISADGSILVHTGYYVGNSGYPIDRDIFMSKDYGATWFKVRSGYNYAVKLSADGSMLLAGANNGGALYLTKDDGVSWTEIKSSWSGRLFISSNNNRIYAGDYYTENEGATWVKLSSEAFFLNENILGKTFLTTKDNKLYLEKSCDYKNISGAGYLDLGENATEVAGDGDDYRLVRLDGDGLISDKMIPLNTVSLVAGENVASKKVVAVTALTSSGQTESPGGSGSGATDSFSNNRKFSTYFTTPNQGIPGTMKLTTFSMPMSATFGTLTGTMFSELFLAGVDNLPTGSALYTSDTISAGAGNMTFTNAIVDKNTKYCVVTTITSSSNNSRFQYINGPNPVFSTWEWNGTAWVGVSTLHRSVSTTWDVTKEGEVSLATSASNNQLANNVIGFTTEAKNAGESVKIQINGIVSGLSGLTTGSTYYLGTAGEISASAGLQSRKLGLAISTTQLLIIRDNA